MIGIHADLRGQIECHGEAFAALREQIAVALVGFDGAAEAGVLPHGPQPAAIHGGINAASEGEFAGIAEIALGVPFVEAGGGDDGINGQAGGRGGLQLCGGGGFFRFAGHRLVLAHAPRTAKRRYCKTDHGDRVNDGEAQKPRGGAGVPLAPGGDAAIQSEEGEDCAGGFVKELADGAPHYAQGDFRGAPERGVEARGHWTILVQIARRRGRDWRGMGFTIAGQELRLPG